MPISAKFDQRASGYDKATPIQTDVAWLLAQQILTTQPLLHEYSLATPCWADIGCGTGKLSQAVMATFLAADKKLPMTTLYGVDNSQAMLTIWQNHCQHCSDNLTFHPVFADMQQLPFADCSLTGLMSSFALHWANPSIIAELGRVVKKGGRVYLAIPVKGSFGQVSERFPALPIFPFLPSDDWQQAIGQLIAQRQGELLFLQERNFSHLYPNLKTLLTELKHMGGAVSGQAAMQPKLLRQYLSDVAPIYLDYQLLLVGFTLN